MRIGAYQAGVVAQRSSVRKAASIDGVVVLVLTMLLWPFPVMRSVVQWPVHVVLVLLTIVLMSVAYGGLCLRFWGRSVGMYFADLGLDGAPRPFPLVATAAWSVGFAVTVGPGLLMPSLIDARKGLPARMSGLVTVEAITE